MLLHSKRKKIIKKIINDNKCLNSPNHSLSDFSSLPESENIPSNSSFASKKILDVIFYLIKSMKKILFFQQTGSRKKRIYLTPRQKTNRWLGWQKTAHSRKLYRIKIGLFIQRLWSNNSNNY